eukprot:2902260-Prymnesium_polylepis.3
MRLQSAGFDVVVVNFLSPAGMLAADANQIPMVHNLPCAIASSPGDGVVNKMSILQYRLPRYMMKRFGPFPPTVVEMLGREVVPRLMNKTTPLLVNSARVGLTPPFKVPPNFHLTGPLAARVGATKQLDAAITRSTRSYWRGWRRRGARPLCMLAPGACSTSRSGRLSLIHISEPTRRS